MTPSHKIPPLNPLKVFEVVARTGNLTLAAAELLVSQSAVSRQIAVLEEYLGVKLFMRERIGVKLTAVGEDYAKRIGPAFDVISDATKFITQRYSDNVIRVRTYTTLTARWLIPRLPRFNVQFPDIQVTISNSTAPLDFATESCDMAIVLGDGCWPGAHAVLLLEDEIEPVCSPALIDAGEAGLMGEMGEAGRICEVGPVGEAGRMAVAQRPASRLAKALRRKRLLVSKYRKHDWPMWLAHVEQPELFDAAEKMTFSSSILTWQAAIDGLGIAIGQRYMLEADIEAGRLVRPFGRPFKTGKGHFIVTPSVQRHSPKLNAFRDWLLHEAGANAG